MSDRCRDFEELLIASTLHELSSDDRERIETHLEGCSDSASVHSATQSAK